jgi:hypothetical protein
VAITFTLTTDSNVAARFVTVEALYGSGDPYVVSGAAVTVSASTTNQRFDGSLRRGTSEWNTGTDVFFPLHGVFIDGGQTFRIHIANVQVGDQLSRIYHTFDLFPTQDHVLPEYGSEYGNDDAG